MAKYKERGEIALESQKRKNSRNPGRRRAGTGVKFDLATDLVHLVIYWNKTIISLAVTAIALLVVFLISRSVPGMVSTAGIISLILGGLVLSKGRLAGALLLLGLGTVLIIVAGRL